MTTPTTCSECNTHQSLKFYPVEINGTKYLLCKLPNQPFSTLHDPETKKIVGQWKWNNHALCYEIYQNENETEY